MSKRTWSALFVPWKVLSFLGRADCSEKIANVCGNVDQDVPVPWSGTQGTLEIARVGLCYWLLLVTSVRFHPPSVCWSRSWVNSSSHTEWRLYSIISCLPTRRASFSMLVLPVIVRHFPQVVLNWKLVWSLAFIPNSWSQPVRTVCVHRTLMLAWGSWMVGFWRLHWVPSLPDSHYCLNLQT